MVANKIDNARNQTQRPRFREGARRRVEGRVNPQADPDDGGEMDHALAAKQAKNSARIGRACAMTSASVTKNGSEAL